MGRNRVERVRDLLTEPQWRALDYLHKFEVIHKMPGLAQPTSLRCTASTAAALAEHGAVSLTVSPDGREIIRWVKLLKLGRDLVHVGPPEGLVMRPGHYTWTLRRAKGAS